MFSKRRKRGKYVRHVVATRGDRTATWTSGATVSKVMKLKLEITT